MTMKATLVNSGNAVDDSLLVTVKNGIQEEKREVIPRGGRLDIHPDGNKGPVDIRIEKVADPTRRSTQYLGEVVVSVKCEPTGIPGC